MEVEKAYKGDVKVGEQLKFAQGDEILHCTWAFYQDEIGERYLLYLFKPNKASDPWSIGTCNRSRQVEYVKEDLLYLDNIEKRRGRTRISGTMNAEGNFNVVGRTIRIIGRHKTYVTTTDKDGVYEIYDLPAGRYVIEPELPFGWKVDEFLLTQQRTGTTTPSRPSNRVAFTLRERKHFGVGINVRLSNHISGTVVDSNSQPLQWVCVSLAPVNDQSSLVCNGLTDKRGRFHIDSVAAGTYLLIFNYENKPTREMPFPRLFYPGVIDRNQARTISVKHGESLSGLNVVITLDRTFVP